MASLGKSSAGMLVVISISISVATKSRRLSLLDNSTLDRMGSVCRRSIIPATACRGSRSASRLVLSRVILFSLVMMMNASFHVDNLAQGCVYGAKRRGKACGQLRLPLWKETGQSDRTGRSWHLCTVLPRFLPGFLTLLVPVRARGSRD